MIEKLSKQMTSMLDDVQSGFGTHGTCFHKGEHVGRYSTARALRDRGLLSMDNELTEAGKAALEKSKEKP